MMAFTPVPGAPAGLQLPVVFHSPPEAPIHVAVCACVVVKLAASSPAQRHIVLNLFMVCMVKLLLMSCFNSFALYQIKWVYNKFRWINRVLFRQKHSCKSVYAVNSCWLNMTWQISTIFCNAIRFCNHRHKKNATDPIQAIRWHLSCHQHYNPVRQTSGNIFKLHHLIGSHKFISRKPHDHRHQ